VQGFLFLLFLKILFQGDWNHNMGSQQKVKMIKDVKQSQKSITHSDNTLRRFGESCQLHKVGSDHVGTTLLHLKTIYSNKGHRSLKIARHFSGHKDDNLCNPKTSDINYLVAFFPNYFKML